MKNPLITSALLGAALVGGSTPAFADHDPADRSGGAGPVVNRADCQASDGVFTTSAGVKTCTTTVRSTALTTRAESSPQPSYYGGYQYTGIAVVATVTESVTTQSQQGAGAITETSTSSIVSSTITPTSCSYRYYSYGSYSSEYLAQISACEAYGLYS